MTDDKTAKKTRPRILVADDDPNMLRMLKKILAVEYDVTAAGDGWEALFKNDIEFDLLVLDVLMPGMGGEEVFSAMDNQITGGTLTDGNAPPTIIISGLAREEEKIARLLKSPSVAAYLRKPFSNEAFLETVRKVLDKERA